MKTHNRTKRLKLAPQWINTYTGKNPVRDYARHFSVELICAITEMRIRLHCRLIYFFTNEPEI